ncbi:MAG: DNA polymerase I [Bauldia sp.]|nr:DNA polymerase I [Bauldia sp.]
MSEATAAAPPEAPSGRAPGPGDHVFLVDGSSFVFRAYFQSMNQDAKYNYRSDGLPTGALRLFTTKLYQFILEGAVDIRPTHLAIVFDKAEQTFRKEIYADYKATRREAPDDLIPQFPLMRSAVEAFGLRPVEQSGYEADDIIATYATEAGAAGADTLIISADKDLMQLVTPTINFYDFESGSRGKPGYRPERRIGIPEVIEYFGLPPEKVTDVQALVGDPSDNVPGVPGIGLKTAAALISEYGDLESLLFRVGEIKQPKRRESLVTYAEQARISKKLVTLDRNVAVDLPLSASALTAFDSRRLMAFAKAMEFNTLVRRIADNTGIDPDTVEPDAELRSKGRGTAANPGQVGTIVSGYTRSARPVAAAGGDGEASAADATASDRPLADVARPWTGGDLFGRPGAPPPAAEALALLTPAAGAEAAAAALAAVPFGTSAREIISTPAGLDAFLAEARRSGSLALVPILSGTDVMRADLVGLGMAIGPGHTAYLPLGHRSGETDLLGGGAVTGQMATAEALARLKPILEDRTVRKIGHDLKAAALLLSRHGIALDPVEDVMLLAYALEAGRRDVSLTGLGDRWLDHHPGDVKLLLGTGRNAITFDRVSIEAAGGYAADAADISFRLALVLKPRLADVRVTTVYELLERPMVAVLAAMEKEGIMVDRQILSRLSGDFSQTMARLEDEIATLAGEPFNIGSPKQLGEILFEKKGIPGGRKTKTGAWSTDADILEELAADGHALPARILDWRQVSKLKSTYTDALPDFINPETGRVHTSYALAATPTARLSSSDPNLQNIPVRTEMGRKIRTAFVAAEGNRLISADYSQIELRVLAHMAEIPQLRQAFADGIDIHAMTASEMFGVAVEGMPPDVRRRAKAINFGIVYGISAFGLANQLSIPRGEAKDYIDRYFQRFPGIRDYMESTKAFCRANGFVETIFGRKCHYPLILSRNPAERAFNERAAVNATIQGSAADIIRRAMIRMPGALREAGLSLRMLLQVHDELVFEADEEEVSRALPLIRSVMERAPEPAAKLRVPLQVDARAGDNWEAAH